MRWGTAFKYALKAVLATLIFMVIGGFMLLAALGLMFTNPLVAAPLAIIGLVLYSLGMLIAWFKYIPEAVAEELEQRKQEQ